MITLPKVIFGTSGLGNLYVALPDEVKLAIVQAYIEGISRTGIPFFDSAGKYGAGLALESLGACLDKLNIASDKVHISNKLGWLRVPLTTEEPTFEPGVWKGLKYDAVQKISYDGILECYEQGNNLLGNYHSNYASVHDPDEYLAAADGAKEAEKRYQDILSAYNALHELKKEGKVSAIGIGAKDWHSIARIDKDVQLDWVMIANSMTLHSHPSDLIDFLKKLNRQGTVIINSAVFNGGFLTGGEYYNYKPIDDGSEAGKKMLDWRDRFFSICERFGLTPAGACMQFGSLATGVESIAISTSNPKRVAPNLSLIDHAIPEDFWLTLYEEELISKEGLEMVTAAD